MHKKAISLLLSGFIVFALLFRFIGTSDIVAVLQQADTFLIILAISLQFMMTFTWNLKWKFLFNYLKIKISYATLFPILLVGNLGDTITPGSRFGGEPLRLYYLERIPISGADSLTTILLERAYNVIVFLALSLISFLVLLVYVDLPLWMLIVILIGIVYALSLSLIITYGFINETKGVHFVKRLLHRVLPHLYKISFFKFKGEYKTYNEFEMDIFSEVRHFFDEVIHVIKNRDLWVKGIFLSLLYWFHLYLQAYLVFEALGIHIPFLLVIAFMTISELLGLVLMLPSGVGVVELFMVLFVGALGIPLAQAVAAVLIIRAIYYTFSLGAGYASILWLSRTKGH